MNNHQVYWITVFWRCATVVALTCGATAWPVPGVAQTGASAAKTADWQQQAAQLADEVRQLYRNKQWDEAAAKQRQVVALYVRHTGPDSAETAAVWFNLARILLIKRDIADGHAALLSAIAAWHKAGGPDQAVLFDPLVALAQIHTDTDELRPAEQALLQALAIAKRHFGPKDLRTALALNNLGHLYFLRGDLQAASNALIDALAIREPILGPEDLLVAATQHNIGAVSRASGALPPAEAFLRLALTTRLKKLGERNFETASTRSELGLLLLSTERKSQGAGHLLQVVQTLQELLGKDHPQYAQALVNLGGAMHELGQDQQAEEFYAEAHALLLKYFGPLHPETANVAANRASLAWQRGDHAAAVQLLADSEDGLERRLTLALASGHEAQKRNAARKLESGLHAALTLHLASAPQRADAAQLAVRTLLRRQGRVMEAMTAATAAVQAARLGRNPAAKVLWRQLQQVRTELATLAKRGPAGMDRYTYRETQERLEAQAGRLETELEGLGSGDPQRTAPVEVADVVAALPKKTALVLFAQWFPLHVGDAAAHALPKKPRYAAYVLAPGKLLGVDLGTAETLEPRLAAFRTTLADAKDDSVKAQATQLYQTLLAPLQAQLTGIDALLVVPDGDLGLIPLQALRLPSGQWAGERWKIAVLSAGRDVLAQTPRRQPKSPPLVVAAPNYDAVLPGDQSAAGGRRRHFPPLAGAAAEAAAITPLLAGSSLLTGDAATREALLAVRGPAILHLATHGYTDAAGPAAPRTAANGRGAEVFGDEPESEAPASQATPAGHPLAATGLALAGANKSPDGVMTGLEAMALDLAGTQLVVLSACETGLGEVRRGDGVVGLRRAMAQAGAQSQLAALWEVDDHATKALMVQLYTGLQRGQSPAAALQQAQQLLRSKSATAHPFYWAAFVSSGSASLLPLQLQVP